MGDPGAGTPPFFSVLVSAYNRADQIGRCVASCTAQDHRDFEIVVVDDASTDATPAVLAAIEEPRLRVITHERNLGISPARATGAANARGRWLVIIDSDWELVPGALSRLRELIDGLPPEVRIIRSRLRLDDGTLSPSVLPEGVTDYLGRLRWMEALAVAGGASDAGHCLHRDVLSGGQLFHGGRGPFETLWETDLARREPSLWVADVLGLEHLDAANSTTRDRSPRRAMARLTGESADILAQVQTMLADHGAALERHAPHARRQLLERAAVEALLAGQRRAGARYTLAAARGGTRRIAPWATLGLGLLGPEALAYVKVTGRRLKARASALR